MWVWATKNNSAKSWRLQAEQTQMECMRCCWPRSLYLLPSSDGCMCSGNCYLSHILLQQRIFNCRTDVHRLCYRDSNISAYHWQPRHPTWHRCSMRSHELKKGILGQVLQRTFSTSDLGDKKHFLYMAVWSLFPLSWLEGAFWNPHCSFKTECHLHLPLLQTFW